jgi:hypothetical protein
MPKAKEQLALLETRKPQPEPEAALKSWALVELFGHQRIVGLVTVDPVDFPGMIRVDVPSLVKDGVTTREGFTRYFGRGALYGVSPITEKSAMELLPHVDGKPARPMYLGRDEY